MKHVLRTNDVNFGTEALWISLWYKSVISCVVKGAGRNFKTMDPKKDIMRLIRLSANLFLIEQTL